MLAKDIQVGHYYTGRVSCRPTTFRVDAILPPGDYPGARPRFLATNIATGRQIIVKSAQRFRVEVEIADGSVQ